MYVTKYYNFKKCRRIPLFLNCRLIVLNIIRKKSGGGGGGGTRHVKGVGMIVVSLDSSGM